jgi:uncharacterized protein (DUF1778 family)
MINYMGKMHTIIVRKVSRDVKNSLKRQAKRNRQSVNGFLLEAIDSLTYNEIQDYKITKKQPQ